MNPRFLALGLAQLVVFVFPSACGGSEPAPGCGDERPAESDCAGSGGQGGYAGGAGGSGGGSGGGGGGGGGTPDWDALQACPAEEPCLRSFAQWIDAAERNIPFDRVLCVLEALRDRAPGRYEHESEGAHAHGTDLSSHLLVVAQDESVAYVRRRELSDNVVGSKGATEDAGMRCQLKPASYFESCIAALQPDGDADEAWACAYGEDTPWLEGCVEDSPPVCEPSE